ncbi:MAG: heparinase, partial [Alphaproteobacteria bacterium]|nr:heparinase [Alphaproteobacteria bacterium]
AVLRLEGGEGWIFEASGGRVGLEESVYFGTGERRRCEQLVVSGEIAELPLTLKWRFARATAAEAASST